MPAEFSGWSAAAPFTLALVVIVIVARALAWVATRLGQPGVMGEVVAGIALGPSLLGWVAPQAFAALFPPTVLPLLAIPAQVGIVLYMFLVGAELTAGAVVVRGRALMAISLGSIAVPFVLGVLLAYRLFPLYAPPEVSLAVFATFIGLSLSVTALAVLARILRDWQQMTSPLGALALASAAASDATALSLLAVVIGFTRSAKGAGLWTPLAAVAFIAVMVGLVRPLFWRLASLARPLARPASVQVPITLAGLAASAWVADWIGLEALIGAFLFGAVLPQAAHMPQVMSRRLERAVTLGFLPAFFALTGLRTQIGSVLGSGEWLTCAAIVVVASVGKVGGTWLASRLVGLGQREAIALGVLMNTRGLVELVVLNVGLELGILTPPLFTMFVVMTLATTFATSPLWRWLSRPAVGARTNRSHLAGTGGDD